MRTATALLLLLGAAALAGDPADDPAAVVFLGPLGAGPGLPARDGLGVRAILTDVADAKAWRGVVAAVRARGYEKTVSFQGGDLDDAVAELGRIGAGQVAVVVRPETLDVNFHFALLERASRLDGDPFVDFAFGYVTGATPAEAEAFVRGMGAKPPRTILEFGPSNRPAPLSEPGPHRVARGFSLRRLAHANGEAPDLAAAGKFGIVKAWGHGYPAGVDEGLQGRALRASGLDLSPALYFSGPCYCGVTRHWYSGGSGKIERREVAAEDSFLLALIGARATAVFAGLDPDRGETNHHEFEHLVTTGEPLGMAAKSTYDDVVLAYRRPQLELPEYRVGAGRPHRDIHDRMIAGGACRALFGDPAAQPVEKCGRDPFAATTRATAEGVEVSWSGGNDLGRFWKPVDVFRARGYWTHRIRLTVELPLEQARRLRGLRVLEVTKDGDALPHTYATAALESWAGAARAHLMVVFPRELRALRGGREYRARFLLTFAEHDAAQRSLPDPVEEAAARRRVSPDALAAARAANDALRSNATATAELAALARFERDGFEAALALLEGGKSHHRSEQLLRATYFAGGEESLLALADGPPLPAFGSWAVLRGLSIADTPAVRHYLLARLKRETNPGLFLCASEALGRLGEARAAPAVTDRLLRFAPGWRGVEPRLLHALASIAGDRAAPHLVRYLADERASPAAVGQALRLLEGVDRAAAREAARTLRKSDRFARFEAALQAIIERAAR